ncbi:hypothetical protein II906_07560, partial [bacterium]|nr:hypothetical protein [bacterium]
MAKLVILKSFLDAYYDNLIEKSTTHKYIRRVPKSTGKGYNYFYPEDFKKPIKALLSFFGMKEDKIDKAYENNNINQAYGVTKQGFAQHVLEYLTNRKTWNTFFANKANREKYKIPEKPVKETEKVTVSEKEIVGEKTKEKLTVEAKETKEKNFKSTWNRSLMRKIYSMYNSVPEDKSENNPGIDTIKVGDKVSYNGRTGTVTKDFENGLMFVNFENGGMGRFFVKDLQKMDVSAEEVTETATENAVEQEVNGTNAAVQETVDDVDLNDSHYWDEKRLESEKKLAESYGYEAFKNGVARATANDEKFNNYLNNIQDNKDTISTDDAIKGVKSVKHQLMAEWLSGWDRANIEAQVGEKDTSALSEAMMGNQNAKKNFTKEDLESGRISVKEIYNELDKNGDNYSREERLAMQKLVKDYVDSHADEFETSHGYLESVDDWYVTEVLEDRKKYKSVNLNGGDTQYTKNTMVKYAELKSEKALKDIDLNSVDSINIAIENVKDDVQRAMRDKESTDSRVSVKGELDSIAGAMLYKKLLDAKEKVGKVNKNDAIDYYVSGDGMWINKYLRNPEQFEKENGAISEQDKQVIEELDN